MRRPLIGLTLCVLTGTWLGLSVPLPFQYPLAAGAVLLSGWWISHLSDSRTCRALTLLPAVAAITWASAACRAERPAAALRQLCISGTAGIEVIGIVADDPAATRTGNTALESWNFKFSLEMARGGPGLPWQELRGTVNASWCAPRTGKPPAYGDRWRMPCAISTSQGSCRIRGNWYRAEHLSGDNGSDFVSWCYRQRHMTSGLLARGIEDFAEHVALIHALVLGYRQKLSADTWTDFALTGSLHIFAISGLHVGMVAFIIAFVLTSFRISRIYWPLFLSPLLIIYTVATGMRASAVRACIMAIIFFSAPLLKRRADALSALALAAIIIVAASPTQLLDRGFVFSFVVVTGLIVFYRHFFIPLHRLVSPDPLRLQTEPKWLVALRAIGYRVASLVAISFSAWLTSAPLSAYFFGRFVPVALLANLMVVPLAFLIVLTGCLSLITGSCFLFLASLFNHANLALVSLLRGFIGLIASVPGGSLDVPPPSLFFVVLWYGALLLVAARLRSRKADGGPRAQKPHLDIGRANT